MWPKIPACIPACIVFFPPARLPLPRKAPVPNSASIGAISAQCSQCSCLHRLCASSAGANVLYSTFVIVLGQCQWLVSAQGGWWIALSVLSPLTGRDSSGFQVVFPSQALLQTPLCVCAFSSVFQIEFFFQISPAAYLQKSMKCKEKPICCYLV